MPTWYGAQPVWWAPLERDARRHFGSALRHTYRRGSLTYELTGLDVIGEPEPIDVSIRFYENPLYPTFDQMPQDFPRVHANPGPPRSTGIRATTPSVSGTRSTRKSDGGRVPKGLLDLIEIVRTHLFLEHYWRLTGGEPAASG